LFFFIASRRYLILGGMILQDQEFSGGSKYFYMCQTAVILFMDIWFNIFYYAITTLSFGDNIGSK
jgi:hypothetical protein